MVGQLYLVCCCIIISTSPFHAGIDPLILSITLQ